MSELKGPSEFEIKNIIKNKSIVEFHTFNDKVLKGTLIWADENAYHLKLEDNSEITLLKKSVLFYKKCVWVFITDDLHCAKIVIASKSEAIQRYL